MAAPDLSHYRTLEELGHGAMGTVYLAEDISLRRQVAVKVLSPTLVGDDRYRRRFLIEARAAASLSHPNIAVVHEVGEESETVFIVMTVSLVGLGFQGLQPKTERGPFKRSLIGFAALSSAGLVVFLFAA